MGKYNKKYGKFLVVWLIFVAQLVTRVCLKKNKRYNNQINLKEYVNKILLQKKYNLHDFTEIPHHHMSQVLSNISSKAMVVSDDIRCSRVGIYQLKNGGNAIDAAIATQLCMSVIEFQSTGLAGGGFAISVLNGRVNALDFREMAPKKMSIYNIQPKKLGAHSFGIPGIALGLYKLWKRGGQLRWSTLFELPIIIAYKGWKIKHHFYVGAKMHAKEISKDSFLKRMLFRGKVLKNVGEKIRNINLAKSLYMLSKNPMEMNSGKLALAMVRKLRRMHAVHKISDFKSYKPRAMNILKSTLNRDKLLITTSERSGGPLLSYMVNSMKGFKMASPKTFKKSGDVKHLYYRKFIKFMKESFKFTSILIGRRKRRFIKMAFLRNSRIKNKRIKRRNYNSRWLKRNELEKLTSKYNSLDIRGTSSLSVIDVNGNGVTLTSTINHIFGAKFTFPGTGIVANNDLADYNRYTKNSPKPKVKRNNPTFHRRPLSSMAPTVIMDKKSGRITGLFSSSGGKKIPTTLAQVIINYYMRQLPLTEAIGHFRIFHPYKPKYVYSEKINRIPKKIVHYLKRYRYKMRQLEEAHSSGAVGIVLEKRKYNKYKIIGVADFRKDGGSAGF